MNKYIIFLASCLLIYNLTIAQTPTFQNDPHWELKWQDDFNSFDNTKWVNANYCDHGGTKPYVHLESNVWVTNGNLVIRTNSNATNCQTNLPCPATACGRCCSGETSYNYTSGWVETKADYDTQFGYMEAKIKMTYRQGVGYAFWTFRGHKSQFVNAGEIDIFEMLSDLPSNTITTNVHTCYSDPKIVELLGYDPNCIKPLLYGEHTYSNFSYTDWHTYAVEWDTHKITWYLDGKSFRTLENKNLDNHGNSIVDYVRIILGSGVNSKHLQPPYSTTPFEEYMYVDHVKVYQLKCDTYNIAVNEIPNFRLNGHFLG
jgi:beta-glucanase (GH16 family)